MVGQRKDFDGLCERIACASQSGLVQRGGAGDVTLDEVTWSRVRHRHGASRFGVSVDLETATTRKRECFCQRLILMSILRP